MSTFCPRCGSARLPQAPFCAACGHSFGAVDGPPPTSDGESAEFEGGGDRASSPSSVAAVALDPLPSPSERPSTTLLRPRRRSLVVAIGAAVLVVALLASAVYGYTTSQTLDHTKANLATTTANLATTSDSLTSTQGELGSTKANLATESAARSQADANVTRLNSQVSGLQSQLDARDACVTALKADEGQLQTISGEQTTEFNLSATGSKWAKANDTYISALKDVATDYYNAFSDAWDASYASANSWVAAGNSAASRGSQALKTYNTEIDAINAATKKIDSQMTSLSKSITNTLSLCSAAAGSL